jgi:hypothetical protein
MVPSPLLKTSNHLQQRHQRVFLDRPGLRRILQRQGARLVEAAAGEGLGHALVMACGEGWVGGG